MKVYKLPKKMVYFFYLLTPVIFIVFGDELYGTLFNWNLFKENWIVNLITVSFLLVLIFFVIEVYKRKFIITKDRIISVSAFSTKEMKFDEIKGFTHKYNHILIEPKNQNQKKIKITSDFEKNYEIESWLSKTFDYIPDQTLIEEDEILENKRLGATRESREEALKKARSITRAIDISSFILLLLASLYPKPYQLVMLLSIAIPIISIIVSKMSKGLIRLDGKKGSSLPHITYGFISTPIGILFRIILDYEIFDFTNAWIYATFIALFLLFFILRNQNEFKFEEKSSYLAVTSIFLFLFLYGLGTVLFVNCYYNTSDPQIYYAKVLSKEIRSGKSTNHYMILSTWKLKKDTEEFNIGKELYYKLKVGGEIEIHYRNGLLAIPWIEFLEK